MRHLLAILSAATLVGVAAPTVRAAPTTLDQAVQALTDQESAYMKKGGKGWRHGRKVKRHGPPPWAPAWGRRAKLR